MLLATHHNHSDEVGDDKSKIDLEVREEDEPSIAAAALDFAGALGASYAAGWVLAANTDTKQEAIGSQGCKKSADTATCTICART